ncbi:hypothetical protein LCGC14_0350320 [marine sediment metagenome]|uniref:Mannose-6-phosphate isomerase type II C-terminal domain-containing protein n=1 Tax=marine sediment metagenome TaxID=412755 RepID=A0A0F9TB80_9ZZZZ
MKIVNKPWGYEKWLHEGKYVLKEIFIKKGFKTSLQYHKKKTETNYIIRGKAKLQWSIVGYEIKKKGDYFHVNPNEAHRVEALTDLLMIEASTPEVDDIVRLEDDYDRGNGRIDSEHEEDNK